MKLSSLCFLSLCSSFKHHDLLLVTRDWGDPELSSPNQEVTIALPRQPASWLEATATGRVKRRLQVPLSCMSRPALGGRRGDTAPATGRRVARHRSHQPTGWGFLECLWQNWATLGTWKCEEEPIRRKHLRITKLWGRSMGRYWNVCGKWTSCLKTGDASVWDPFCLLSDLKPCSASTTITIYDNEFYIYFATAKRVNKNNFW